MAIRLISGVLREVWRETTPLDGGTSRVITTGIRADSPTRFVANLFCTPVIGTPQIAATLSVVGGVATVTVTNNASVGNSAVYALDLVRLQSTQQAPSTGSGVVHVAVTKPGESLSLVNYADASGTNPAAGTIVRSTGVVNKFTSAQADSPAHAASVLGVWTGTEIQPLLGSVSNIRCSAAPVIGQPLYLSSVVAGVASHVPPPIALTPFGVVVANTSIGIDYRASVLCPYQSLTAAGLEDALTLETLADLGGAAPEWDIWLEDWTCTASSTVAEVEHQRWKLYGTATSEASVIKFPNGQPQAWVVSLANTLLNPRLSSFSWRLSARVKVPATSIGDKVLYFVCDGGILGIGVFPGYSATKWLFTNSPTCNPQANEVPGAAYRQEMGSTSSNWTQIDIECDGGGASGNVRWRIDGGTWSAWIAEQRLVGSSCQLLWLSIDGTDVARCDWIYLARKVRP